MRSLACSFILASAGVASAQTLVTNITADRSSLAPGQTLTGTLSLSNSAGNPTLFLEGLAYPGLPDGFLIDDASFFANAPLSLAAGGSWTGAAFQMTLEDGFPNGLLSQPIHVLGGPTTGDQGVIGTATLTVQAVPEPATMAGFAVFSLAVLRRRRGAR